MPNSRKPADVATETETPEVERLRQELDREHQMYLRALADFDNYRRRVEQERATVSRREKRTLILSLLDLLDNFDRALEHTGQDSAASEGLRAIHRQLQSMLESEGITSFRSVGETFDPAIHEAVGSDTNGDPGRVTQELLRGYRWGGELLRPARVRVAQ
jgi:molecular chaperone GrpE